MHTLTRVAALMCFGVLIAGVSNAARSKPLPWILDRSKDVRNPEVEQRLLISLDELKRHVVNLSAGIIDARSPDLYRQSHLLGAYNVPSDSIEAHIEPIYANFTADHLLIVYCDGGNCEASHRVVEFLQASNFTNLRIFKEGWELLEVADVPKVSGPTAYGDEAADPALASDPLLDPAGEAADPMAPADVTDPSALPAEGS